VLLVITDGDDNASLVTMDRIQQQGEQQDTEIYAVELFEGNDLSRMKRGRRELDHLTERTGGVAYYTAPIDQIDSLVLEIARQIRNDYTIAYAPVHQALDGSYRAVRVFAAGSERFTVRPRAGYRAPSDRVCATGREFGSGGPRAGSDRAAPALNRSLGLQGLTLTTPFEGGQERESSPVRCPSRGASAVIVTTARRPSRTRPRHGPIEAMA
jgi:hypothetical protein